MDKADMIELMKNSILAKDNPIMQKKIEEWANKDPWEKINRRGDEFEDLFKLHFNMYASDSIEFYVIRSAYDEYSEPYSGQLGHIKPIRDKDKISKKYLNARNTIRELFDNINIEFGQTSMEEIDYAIDMLILTPAKLKSIHKELAEDTLSTKFSHTRIREIIADYNALLEHDPITKEKSFKELL